MPKYRHRQGKTERQKGAEMQTHKEKQRDTKNVLSKHRHRQRETERHRDCRKVLITQTQTEEGRDDRQRQKKVTPTGTDRQIA